MSKEKATSQNHAEMTNAAQEAAIKEAMEQVQAMYGSIPGFQMPDMGSLQELMASQPMEYASQVMQEFDEMNEFDEEWTINRSGDGELTGEQLRLLAFGAPMLVYNDERIDTIDSENDRDTIKYTLKEWWDVTDHKSTMQTVKWLFEEGAHAEADYVLADIHRRGMENIPTEERCNEENKMGDACLIVESMLENGWCPAGKLPLSAMAWDLVRAVNLSRWAYLCDYINESEMWQMMQITADIAQKYFFSWEEYGRSFVLGRGLWHGDPQDSETAYEIVTLLLESEESPWKQLVWEK